MLVIGGGAVGLEVAGEVATDFPEKQVTLVHSGKALLDTYPPRLGSLVLSQLQQLGVKVSNRTPQRSPPPPLQLEEGKSRTLCMCTVRVGGEKWVCHDMWESNHTTSKLILGTCQD